MDFDLKYFISRRRALFGMGSAVISAIPPISTYADTLSPSALSPDAFRDEVVAVGRRHFPTLPMLPGRGRDVLWGRHHLYLDNLYLAVGALPPAQREKAILVWLAHFSPEADAKASAIIANSKTWAKAKPLLRPKLLPLDLTSTNKQLVSRSFSSKIAVGYAIDLGDKDLYLTRETMTSWNVTLAEIDAAALANLESLSQNISLEAKTPPGGRGRLLIVTTGDGYDASRILLPAFRTRLLSEIGSSVLAGIPGRDLFMLWSHDFSMAEHMVEDIRDLSQRVPHPLTDEIFAIDTSSLRLVTDAKPLR